MPTGSFWSDGTRASGSGVSRGPASQPKGGFGRLADQASNAQRVAPAAPPPSTTTGTTVPSRPPVILRQQADTGALGNQVLPNYRPLPPPPAQVNPLGGVRSLVDAMYGPQQVILDNTLGRQYDQLGAIGEDTRYRQDALQRDTALSRQGIGLDRQQLGIDQAGLGLDRQALGVDRNLTQGQLANLDRLRGVLGQRYGLQGEQLANQLAGLDIDESKLRDMSARELFDLRSNLTARGAFTSVANERGTGRNQRDLMYGIGQIGTQRTAADIANRGAILGLDEQGIGYDNQELGLNARLQNIGIDLQRVGLNDARLSLNGQRLNITEQQLNNGLQDGLRQIGLEGQVNLNGLLDAIGGTNAQQAQLATTILQQLMQFSNLPPEVIAQLTNALGLRSPATPAPGAPRQGSGVAGPPL